METKDLILLMMMPILLVSIIFYTNSNPITGMATAENEENDIIGTYSINPSFKAKVDYDLNYYQSIKSELDTILKKCENTQNIEKCLKENAPENWMCPGAKPESKDEALKILDDFINKFQRCSGLKEDGVVCRILLDERDLTYLPTPQRIFEIVLTDEGPRTKVELKQNKVLLRPPEYINFGNLYYTNFDLRDTLNEAITPVSIFVLYQSQKPVIKNIEGVDDNSNPIPLANSLMFYKKNNIVKFVEATGASFMDPIVNKIIDISEAKGIKFCAKTGKKIYAYDASDSQVKLRDVVYKFAVSYPSLPPEPVKNVEVFDKPKAEKSVLLKWENSSDANAVKYRIYYTEIPDILSKTSTEDLRINPRVTVKDLILSEYPSFDFEDTLNMQECVYENRKCMFSTSEGAKTAIENGKLYYFKNGNYYVYNVVLPNDNVNYDFAVTALDKNNNEINNINEKQKMLVKTIKSTDGLPPDSGKIVSPASIKYISPQQVIFTFLGAPTVNIDGSTLRDLKEYKVYYSKHQTSSQQGIIELQNSISDSKLNKLQSGITYSQEGSNFIIDISSTDPASADLYFFVIVALDNAGNPKEDKFKVKELGAVPLQLTIP
ncbi:hypothetical protein HYW20_01425 [Candidatus Woesearchaeota archaeon]|nr:hypothetical protein [Candidatus Woesearchaeota archaeon]